jgi:hypothetical protein
MTSRFAALVVRGSRWLALFALALAAFLPLPVYA